MRYWHGGPPGLKPGDVITPRDADDTAHLVDGCPTCEARRAGTPLPDDDNDPNLVYVTTNREYARIYAAGYPRGGLYRVEPEGPLTSTGDSDAVESWGCRAARVLTVYDAVVIPRPTDLRRWQRMAVSL